jgi:hypothetical protein
MIHQERKLQNRLYTSQANIPEAVHAKNPVRSPELHEWSPPSQMEYEVSLKECDLCGHRCAGNEMIIDAESNCLCSDCRAVCDGLPATLKPGVEKYLTRNFP